jgi:peptidoglycan/LPS O-acetylase OafA/YrhL
VFYARRACRIFPLYFAFLALIALGTWLVRWPMFTPSIPWPFQVSFTQNLWMAAHNTFGSNALRPTWSLCVEEQFYLLLPLLVYAVKPSRLPWIAGAGILGAALIRLGLGQVAGAYTLLPCRMNALLIGVLAAWFVRQPRLWQKLLSKRNDLRRALLILLGCLPLFLANPAVDSRFELLVGLNAFPIYYALLLVASLADEGISRILRVRWLMRLGGIAYCAYLIHYPILGMMFRVLRVRTVASGLLAASLALTLTILVAMISWKWFERPFIRLGHRASYSGSREAAPIRTAQIVEARP